MFLLYQIFSTLFFWYYYTLCLNYHVETRRKYEPFQASRRTYFQVNVLYKNLSGVYCLQYIAFTVLVQFLVLKYFFRSRFISSRFRNERERVESRGQVRDRHYSRIFRRERERDRVKGKYIFSYFISFSVFIINLISN